jgi:hypothetical protein
MGMDKFLDLALSFLTGLLLMLCILAAITLLLGGCSMPHDFGASPPHLQPVCIRWEASDGFLYGRDATFASHMVDKATSDFPHSHLSPCVDTAQGPTYRVEVCLANSSPCAHDRTTEVWPDQVEYYLEKYPGSHRGPCTSECSKHEDTCLDGDHRGPENWRQWMMWMREVQRQRRPGA